MRIRYLLIALSAGLLTLFVASVGKSTVVADPPDPDAGVLLPPAVFDRGDEISICYSGCGGATAPAVNAAYEQQVVEMVNAERAARGLPPLKRATSLQDAARYHAADMGQDNYFDHDTYDRVAGDLQWVCDVWTRIRSYYPSPTAENSAAGYATPQSVMDAWMDSGGHQDNILSAYSWEIGVGYYEGGGTYYRYWVQNFGRQSGVYPLVINQEAATTESVHVSLYLYGEDWDEVRLRNDDGSWSSWQPFANTLDWTLAAGLGEHTVWAEMRAGDQMASSSDTIEVVASPSLDGLPDAVRFTYSIPDGRLLPASSQVTPRNGGNDDLLTWSLNAVGEWFTVSPLSGATPDPFWIAPTTFDTGVVGTYAGAVTVTVTHVVGVEGSPHRIDLTLQVIDAPFHDLYLPLVSRGYAP
jgi:hypothetical protein